MKRNALVPISAPPAIVEGVEFEEHYSALGMYVPPRRPLFVPYARRLDYAGSGRHHLRADRVRSARAAREWAVSRLRDLGDALFGPFIRSVAA